MQREIQPALFVVDKQHLAAVVAILDGAVLRAQVAQMLAFDAERVTDLDRGVAERGLDP